MGVYPLSFVLKGQRIYPERIEEESQTCPEQRRRREGDKHDKQECKRALALLQNNPSPYLQGQG
jgi:hypothetical protein